MFSHCPGLASIAFEALASWTRIEVHQFELFVEIRAALKTPDCRNTRRAQPLKAKRNYMAPIATERLNESELAMFCKLLRNVRSYSKKRNKLAHWSWRFVENFPFFFLLVVPDQFVLENIDHSKVQVSRMLTS